MIAPPADILAWDSSFFGCVVARVRGSRMDPRGYDALVEWSQSNRVEWLYFLADANDRATLDVARTHGFDLVDIRMTLERIVQPDEEQAQVTAGVHLRAANEGDLPTLSRIASRLHESSRFFADRNVPEGKAAALYSMWIEKSVQGDLADVVFVADVGGRAQAYVTGRVESEGHATIGLLGVDQGARGLGLGQNLVRRVLEHLSAGGVRRVEVVTQGTNVIAQRLYQRCGFLTRSVELWYHIWLR